MQQFLWQLISAKSLYKCLSHISRWHLPQISSHLQISHHVVSSASKTLNLTLTSASSLLKINLFKALMCFLHVLSTKCFYRQNLTQAYSARVSLVPLITKTHRSSHRSVPLTLLLTPTVLLLTLLAEPRAGKAWAKREGDLSHKSCRLVYSLLPDTAATTQPLYWLLPQL